jgi:pentose-5-phosphate-3-epimerase/CBS domain-containing protein
MKISGSVFAVKDNYLEYARQLRFANVDYLHVDLFQNSAEFCLKDILLFDNSFLPLDVHLIFEGIASEDIAFLNTSTASILTIQYENLSSAAKSIETAREFKGDVGIAILPGTSQEEVQEYFGRINHVLVMCSEPGVSGARFDERSYEVVERIRTTYPSLKVYVDGGISAGIAKKMGDLGVSLVVSGSYLAKNLEYLHYNAYDLKYLSEENISVQRNMLKFQYLPIIQLDTNLFDALTIINEGKIGCGFVVQSGKFMGMITDGDIRRAYLIYKKDIFEIASQKIMNASPFTVNGSATIKEVHDHLVKNHLHWIKVIPVVENDMLIGAIEL